jgi:hypothetical protein
MNAQPASVSSDVPEKFTGMAEPSRRMLRLIASLIEGFSCEQTREPLFLYEAAKSVGYQRRAARKLFDIPVFVRAYESQRAALSSSRRSHVPTARRIQEAVANDMRRRPADDPPKESDS